MVWIPHGRSDYQEIPQLLNLSRPVHSGYYQVPDLSSAFWPTPSPPFSQEINLPRHTVILLLFGKFENIVLRPPLFSEMLFPDSFLAQGFDSERMYLQEYPSILFSKPSLLLIAFLVVMFLALHLLQ